MDDYHQLFNHQYYGIWNIMTYWLVVWNIFIFHNIWIYIYGIILPID